MSSETKSPRSTSGRSTEEFDLFLYYLRLRACEDPAVKYVPLRGKLVATQSLCATILFLFIQEIVLNHGHESASVNAYLGPSRLVFILSGAVVGRRILFQGEWWRLIWGCFLHAGWIHLIFNLLSLYRIGLQLEPDWGCLRFLSIFVISALSGNLLSVACRPTGTSLGCSGGVFGIMTALFPYCIEYWTTIPDNNIILGFLVLNLIISLALGFLPFVDNYAHLGGATTGFLLGMATLKRIAAWDVESEDAHSTDATKDAADLNGANSPCKNSLTASVRSDVESQALMYDVCADDLDISTGGSKASLSPHSSGSGIATITARDETGPDNGLTVGSDQPSCISSPQTSPRRLSPNISLKRVAECQVHLYSDVEKAITRCQLLVRKFPGNALLKSPMYKAGTVRIQYHPWKAPKLKKEAQSGFLQSYMASHPRIAATLWILYRSARPEKRSPPRRPTFRKAKHLGNDSFDWENKACWYIRGSALVLLLVFWVVVIKVMTKIKSSEL